MTNLNVKLEQARKEAKKIYEAHGLGDKFESAMDVVRNLNGIISNENPVKNWKCESDGKWWA